MWLTILANTTRLTLLAVSEGYTVDRFSPDSTVSRLFTPADTVIILHFLTLFPILARLRLLAV